MRERESLGVHTHIGASMRAGGREEATVTTGTAALQHRGDWRAPQGGRAGGSCERTRGERVGHQRTVQFKLNGRIRRASNGELAKRFYHGKRADRNRRRTRKLA